MAEQANEPTPQSVSASEIKGANESPCQSGGAAHLRCHHNRKAIERAPVAGIFYINLFELYLSAGMLDKAMPMLEKLKAVDRKLAAASSSMLRNSSSTGRP